MVKSEEIGAPAVVETAGTPNQTGSEPDVVSSKRTPSPAFQFYPRDFLLSRRVNRMSMTERGIYITLLAMCWIDGGISPDLDRVARDLGQKPSKFRTMWDRGALAECFTEKHGRLINSRLEDERHKQNAYRAKQANAAAMRWDTQRNASVSDPSRLVSDPSQRTKKEHAAPPSDATPIVFSFPTSGNPPQWSLHQSRIDRFVELYPGIDVMAEMRRALAWMENAVQKKTARGMPAFLARWLSNATDRPRPMLAATGTHGRGRTGAPAAGKYDGIEES